MTKISTDELMRGLEELYGPGAGDRLKALNKAEELAVRELGQKIGFGRIMQLGEQLWREALVPKNLQGGEHACGPCVAFLVPCPCKGAAHCDWCCGAGRVTKRVREAMLQSK